MEKFLAIILMVIPGFIIRKIKTETETAKEIKSDTEKTIVSLIYSVPVLILNLFILVFMFKFTKMDQLLIMFEDLQFILEYSILTIISTIIVSISLILIETKLKMKFVNFLRAKRGEPEKTNSISPWEDFFKESKEMPVKILRNGNIIAQGFIKHWDLDGKSERDIVLVHVEDMIKNAECFTEIKREYVDYKNDLVIQEYYFDESKLPDNN
ncbi:conserved membrane hypothetical protein [Clostridium neonatale]|uniref:DUF6338 family protein n=1 Tax=Clostridium neonatale TaxID=137838 RepID=UPI00291C0AE6|nr:DUF6338 family protein [Clostridium neonatale]CAI3248902.1 conserved membrane hypothetical protein [Clostridium neonatale]